MDGFATKSQGWSAGSADIGTQEIFTAWKFDRLQKFISTD
jgi:hypothetical protein